MLTVRKALSGALAISCLCGLAHAQDLARPAGIRRVDHDWTLVPVVSHSSTGWSSPGVLALRKKDAAVGDNIVAIWYQSPQSGGAWTATSWASQNQWVAINYIKEQFQISSAYDFMWPTLDSQGIDASETPAPYDRGLFADDPLAAMPLSPERDQMVDLLTDFGYPAASIGFEHEGPCTSSIILSALTDTALLGASTSMTGPSLENHFASQVPDTCATGANTAAAIGTIPGTTIPLPGVPVDPLHPWKRDSRPPTVDASCSTSTQCCYHAFIIFVYIREGLFGIEYLEYCEATVNWNCPRDPDGSCPDIPKCEPNSLTPSGTVSCGHSYY